VLPTIYSRPSCGSPITPVMTSANSLLRLALCIAAGVVLWCVVPGCLGTAGIQGRHAASPAPAGSPVFFPSPPDIPRLQFLRSFSSSADLGAARAKSSRLERFVAGEEEQVAEDIVKPYGLALWEGKLYVCDVQRRTVEVLDLRAKTFGTLGRERRMTNPVNLCVAGGVKYVADPTAGEIFVFGRDDELKTVLGTGLGLKPIDVGARGRRCYITDMKSNQVVVLDVTSGEVVTRMGKAGDANGQFVLIGDMALDDQENVYVTDKLLGRVTEFDRTGLFQKTFGRAGDSVQHFVRPKGIDVDREGRIWVVDAAPEVAKVYDPNGQLLLYFGFPGSQPGSMNLPASIVIDYDDMDLFRDSFAEGAQIEFLVWVSNQYGQKINLYAFGRFPVQERALQEARVAATQEISAQEEPSRGGDASPASARTQSKATALAGQSKVPQSDADRSRRMQEIADIYYRSMNQYRSGQYSKARPGFVEVLNSGLIPPPMGETIRSYLSEIDRQTTGRPLSPGR
jgi:hypothetical protein